jgi:hypothetical protein
LGDAESTEAVISLMSQGRKRGYAGIIATQRLSKLHKDAAAEANNVIIGRTWLDADQARAGDAWGCRSPTGSSCVTWDRASFMPLARLSADQVSFTFARTRSAPPIRAPANGICLPPPRHPRRFAAQYSGGARTGSRCRARSSPAAARSGCGGLDSGGVGIYRSETSVKIIYDGLSETFLESCY